ARNTPRRKRQEVIIVFPPPPRTNCLCSKTKILIFSDQVFRGAGVINHLITLICDAVHCTEEKVVWSAWESAFHPVRIPSTRRKFPSSQIHWLWSPFSPLEPA
uniref:Uncharacterized protein n=1 Tax=Chelydra serpentina TaxID=8475 RepID=A0A8C3XJ42_CHESE